MSETMTRTLSKYFRINSIVGPARNQITHNIRIVLSTKPVLHKP
jgi:hypothetical protein